MTVNVNHDTRRQFRRSVASPHDRTPKPDSTGAKQHTGHGEHYGGFLTGDERCDEADHSVLRLRGGGKLSGEEVPRPT